MKDESVDLGIWDRLTRAVTILLVVAVVVGIGYLCVPLIQQNERMRQRNLELEPVIEFKEHLQVLLVGVLFIMLAGRVTPSQILDILSAGLIFVALLVLVIRPASVLLGLVGTETTRQERTLMAFMAPRGIVAASVALGMRGVLVRTGKYRSGDEVKTTPHPSGIIASIGELADHLAMPDTRP